VEQELPLLIAILASATQGKKVEEIMTPVTATRRTVVGVFDNEQDARDAIRDLKETGFTDTQIGMAAPLKDDTAVFTDGSAKTAAAGAVAGLGTGALWSLGILAGVLPGIGPAIAGGTLAAIVSSATIGAAAGGLAGAFVGRVADEDAERYEKEFRAGKIVVTVQAEDHADTARAIIDRYRAAGKCPTLDA